MDTVLTKDQVQAQLQAKSDDIARRLDALQDEVIGAPGSVRKAIAKNPYVGVGSAIAAGLLVGLLFGGSKNKRKLADLSGVSAHRDLIEGYIRALAEDASKAVKKGAGTEEAVQKALRDRVPLILLTQEETRQKPGILADTFDLVFKTALGFGVKIAMDYLTAHFHLEELAAPLQSQGGTDAAAPVAAFTSEL